MSYFSRLNEDEQIVIRRVMEATFDYHDRDFHAILGVTQAEMRSVLEQWPDLDDFDDDSSTSLAINNSLNDLLHSVRISDETCQEKTGVAYVELLRIYKKWASLRGWDRTGAR